MSEEEEWDEKKFPLPREYYLLMDRYYREQANRELKIKRKERERVSI